MEKIINGIELELKEAQLKKIETDSINWLVYFLDEITNEKWVKEYPQSEYHGGGAPQLRLIDKYPWECL
jgi:hypothetical protein